MRANSRVMGLLMLTPSQRSEKSVLRITTETKRGRLTLYIEGRLTGPWVGALEQCWRELSARGERHKFYIDLCGVSFIDDAGKVLLKEMHRQGGELIAEGCLNQAIVGEIVSTKTKKGSNDKDPEKKGSPIIFYIAFLSLTLGAASLRAQSQNAVPPVSAAADSVRLSLQQAVALALKQNPTQQIAV